jgi:hypothetical protein
LRNGDIYSGLLKESGREGLARHDASQINLVRAFSGQGGATMSRGGYRSTTDVDQIAKLTEAVGNGQCAVLPEFYTRIGKADTWREGEKVRGSKTIKKGTAIATFVNGRYPNKKHGNHAALYVSQDKDGIRVVDQWTGKLPGYRDLPFLGKKDGAYIDPSNNGDAFSIIEHE